MISKAKRFLKYLLFFLWSNIIYGFLLYFVFTWLAGYSVLLAYLGNIALIILGLVWDELNVRFLQPKKLVPLLKREKNMNKSYRGVQVLLDSFISFKTSLYLFYIIILIASQILTLYPFVVNENIRGFILANSYSILFLIAIDTFIGQFSKDRERMKKNSEGLKKSLFKKTIDE